MVKKISLFLVGGLLLVSGITCVFKNWEAIMILFKGVLGMVLAVTGLIVLSFINDDKSEAS